MTVSQDMYGARLDRKNIPPPLSFNFPSLSLQQASLQQANISTIPKSAPPQPTSNDLMQYQLQLMLQNEAKTPAPTLQTQFSTPSSLPSQFASNLQLYNTPPSPMMPMGLDSPGPLTGEGKNNASRYKTELCRPYEESGSCKYGEKCQFAHGLHELRDLSRHPKYKTELCRTFHTIGFCPYGPRCHFIHNTEEKRAPPISPGPHNPGSNATLQNLPALLSLLQQSNVNKIMAFLAKMQMQLGANSTDEVLQYLNFNAPNLMSPPSTPNMNMFSFPEYMVPAAQALNQAARSTSNIHNYFNFNLALKDQHLSSLINAAQLSPVAPSPIPQHHLFHGTPPNMSPAGTPPLSSESSPVSDRSGEAYHMMQQNHMTGHVMYEGYQGPDVTQKMSAEYMVPGRIIAEQAGQDCTPNGKRLPIFNQLSDRVY